MSDRLTRLYFRRQLLHPDTRVGDPVDAARMICGVNAQRAPSVYLSFWNRMHRFSRKTLEDALYRSKTLVKTWCMRGTLHVIPSDLFHIYMKATASSRRWPVSDEFENFCQTVFETLETSRTKAEIANMVSMTVELRNKELHTWVDRAVRLLGYRGQIVYGKPQGEGISFRECMFVQAEAWLSAEDCSISEKEAQKQLLSHYLECYGPAAVQDFAYWAGIRVKESQETFDSAHVEEVKVEGSKRRYYMKSKDSWHDEDESETIVLLPEYGSYVMGHKDKSRIMTEQARSKIFLPLAQVAAPIVKNGRIIGTWKMKKEKNVLNFRINPFEKIEEHDFSLICEEMEKITHVIGAEKNSITAETL